MVALQTMHILTFSSPQATSVHNIMTCATRFEIDIEEEIFTAASFVAVVVASAADVAAAH